MGKEQRRSRRVAIEQPVKVIIRDNYSGQTLMEDEGRISDISRHGLRLTVYRAKIGEYHLFYSFHENAEQTIYLAARNSSADVASFPELTQSVRPVWFDRCITRPDKPFQLGMEFLEPPSKEITEWLNAIIADQKKSGPGGWWARLFSQGWKREEGEQQEEGRREQE